MKYRRRRYIVDTGFQGRFLLGFVAVALAGSIAATVFFIFSANQRLEKLQWSAFVTARSTVEVLEPLFIYVNLVAVVFVSVLLVVTWIWMMRKINGPLNGIVKNLKRVKEGDFSAAIILRRRDEFKDVAAGLNEMLDKTRERFSGFKAGYEEISQALADLEMAVAKGTAVKGKEARIIEMIRKLKDRIAVEKEVSSELP